MKVCKKKLFFMICLMMVNQFLNSNDSGLQQRTTVSRKKVCDVQAEIGSIAEQILTTLTALISSLSDEISRIIKKMKLLASGNDQFFSKRKAHQLEIYKKKLEVRMKKLQTMLTETEKDLIDLDKNYDL